MSRCHQPCFSFCPCHRVYPVYRPLPVQTIPTDDQNAVAVYGMDALGNSSQLIVFVVFVALMIWLFNR